MSKYGWNSHVSGPMHNCKVRDILFIRASSLTYLTCEFLKTIIFKFNFINSKQDI